MTDLLSNAESWLMDVSRDHLATSNTITYCRTDEQDLDLTDEGVVILQSGASTQVDDGLVYLDSLSLDFAILYTLIDFGLGPTEPLVGDQIIVEYETGEIVTYGAVSANGEPVWFWHDRHNHTTYRIQTQRLKVE